MKYDLELTYWIRGDQLDELLTEEAAERIRNAVDNALVQEVDGAFSGSYSRKPSYEGPGRSQAESDAAAREGRR